MNPSVVPMRSTSLLLRSSIAVLALAHDGSAAQAVGTPPFRRVALTSDPAPGTPAGVVFSDFGGVPGANGDFPPRIDAQGNVLSEERNAHQWRRVRYLYMDCRREAGRRGLVIRGPR